MYYFLYTCHLMQIKLQIMKIVAFGPLTVVTESFLQLLSSPQFQPQIMTISLTFEKLLCLLDYLQVGCCAFVYKSMANSMMHQFIFSKMQHNKLS